MYIFFLKKYDEITKNIAATIVILVQIYLRFLFKFSNHICPIQRKKLYLVYLNLLSVRTTVFVRNRNQIFKLSNHIFYLYHCPVVEIKLLGC